MGHPRDYIQIITLYLGRQPSNVVSCVGKNERWSSSRREGRWSRHGKKKSHPEKHFAGDRWSKRIKRGRVRERESGDKASCQGGCQGNRPCYGVFMLFTFRSFIFSFLGLRSVYIKAPFGCHGDRAGVRSERQRQRKKNDSHEGVIFFYILPSLLLF